MKRNPFALNFGIIPSKYIGRELIIDEIISEFSYDDMQNPCFMLTGVRGSGKTVTLTSIERELEDEDDWIVIQLNPNRDMLVGLCAKLYDSKKYIKSFIDASLNLSKFGIGIDIKSTSPVADVESAIEIILNEIRKQKKKLLVTIDEVSNTEYMREFAGSYQLFIRKQLPIYLVMAGLYENVKNLEDEENLTFLYRTPQYEMEPLNQALIADIYTKTLDISAEQATEMAQITKGYPICYQALGKYVWEAPNHELSGTVLAKVDEALARYVYRKIWSELSPMDKKYMSIIAKHEVISTAELLSLAGKKKNEFSQYRSRLKEKGLIDVSSRGEIKSVLPRLYNYIQNEY